jgi:hypothetical protein
LWRGAVVARFILVGLAVIILVCFAVVVIGNLHELSNQTLLIAGDFLILVVVCGGLNAALIAGVVKIAALNGPWQSLSAGAVLYKCAADLCQNGGDNDWSRIVSMLDHGYAFTGAGRRYSLS